VGSLPAASSTAAAVANWLTAANYAACTDLSSVFYTRWGFPHLDGTVTAHAAASSVREPSGMCPGGSAPSPPVNATPPTIAGTAASGGTLTEINGAWSNPATGFNFPTGYSYQWEHCDSTGSRCSKIPRATDQTYTLAPSDVGHTITRSECERRRPTRPGRADPRSQPPPGL
jgi:hypothetical protein